MAKTKVSTVKAKKKLQAKPSWMQILEDRCESTDVSCAGGNNVEERHFEHGGFAAETIALQEEAVDEIGILPA